jgi:hypothetical protein
MLIDPALLEHAAEFVKNRVAMQQEHMQTIWRSSTQRPRNVPLFDGGPRRTHAAAPMRCYLCRRWREARGCWKHCPQQGRSAGAIAVLRVPELTQL